MFAYQGKWVPFLVNLADVDVVPGILVRQLYHILFEEVLKKQEHNLFVTG